MNFHLILFLAFGAVCVAGAVNLLAQRHPINSALSLITVMAALAGEYLLLGAEFVAAVQVIVYAGAIMVLFVFVIMLLNAGEEEETKGSRVAVMFGVPGMLIGGVLIAWVVLRHSGTEAVAIGALPGDLDKQQQLSDACGLHRRMVRRLFYSPSTWLMRFSRSAKVARMSSKGTGSERYISRIAS